MGKEKQQSDKFKEAAREHECDESEERFERALKRVLKQPDEEGGGGKCGALNNRDR